jgi:hypothetical protein
MTGDRMEGRVVAEGVSLVEFLGDLRADLVMARQRAVEDAARQVAANGAALWLEVGEATVTVEVARTGKVSGEASAEVEGKFWVFGSAKAGAKVGAETSRTGTQTLTLTLKPRFERLVKGENGRWASHSSTVEIDGELDPGEQLPPEVGSEIDSGELPDQSPQTRR